MRRSAVLVALAVLAALALPGAASAAGSIGALSVAPSQVRAGAPATGTVSLAFADPAATVVQLFSSDPSVASVPATVVVPAGAMSADFTISTNAAAAPEIVQITAAVGGVPRMANLSVNAATPAGNSLSAVSFVPASVTGGSSSTGTVRFTGPMPDGAVVQLSSSNPAVARVPSETVVSANQPSATFNVTTTAVSARTTVTVTASWFGVTRSATLTVSPGAPPAPDRVAIKTAKWKAGLLTIEATSTNPNAILSVFSSSGSFMFDLTNQGGGRYFDQRGFITNPVRITVRSNFGGSASASTSN
jgi:hypothetical protein